MHQWRQLLLIEMTATEFEACKWPIKWSFPPLKKTSQRAWLSLIFHADQVTRLNVENMTEMVKHEQRSIFESSAIFVYVLISSQVLYGLKMCQALNANVVVLARKSKTKSKFWHHVWDIKWLQKTRAWMEISRSSSFLFFFFSSNKRSKVLKLCKSWYETRFFAERAVIAAI